MICSRCGTNIDEHATQCEYCGLKFKTAKPQAMFKESNENWQKMTPANTYTVPDSSSSRRKTSNAGFLVFVCIFLALVVGVFIYRYYGIYKLDNKYSELTNRYGLTNKEIEENISGFFYRTWYYYDNSNISSDLATCTFTKDKLVAKTDDDDFTTDYKITQISREKKEHVFAIRVLTLEDDTYVSFMPYTKKDNYGNKLYDYLVSYDSDSQEIILYDRPIEQISKSDRIY